jgi:hypothetical protein
MNKTGKLPTTPNIIAALIETLKMNWGTINANMVAEALLNAIV